MLDIIRSSHLIDSRRSYNCVKFLVSASSRSSLVKEVLNKQLDGWQWAVDWLKKTMENHSGFSPTSSSVASSTYGPNPAPMSNEDSNTRTFQRTASAQYTLDQAKALLSEFESTAMEIGEEDSQEVEMGTDNNVAQLPEMRPNNRPILQRSGKVLENGPTKKSKANEFSGRLEDHCVIEIGEVKPLSVAELCGNDSQTTLLSSIGAVASTSAAPEVQLLKHDDYSDML